MVGDPSAPAEITQEESETVDRSEPAPPEAAEERVRERGERVGRYVVLDTIGRGGMGVVYSAWDPQLDRRVALKLVALFGDAEDLAGKTETIAGSRAVQRVRLLREAQALARLEHPNVVQVHDVGIYDRQVFIAMEYVEGASLRDWLRSEPRPFAAIVEAFRSAAEGLAAAHAVGLVHRDFKPDNVLVGAANVVKVADFGLARESEREQGRRGWAQTDPKFAAAVEAASESGTSASESGTHDSVGDEATINPPRSILQTAGTVTLSGAVLGTPAYMAPEQHSGATVDARSDQYSFCISLWEAVYGKRPFAGRDPKLLGERKRKFQIRESTRGTPVPRWLRSLLMRGLATDPGQRFPDMRELIGELERGLTPPRRTVLPWVGLLALAFAIGLVATFVTRNQAAGLCAPPVDRLAGVWDPDRRDAIEAAILSSDAVYARDTWDRVREALDDYSDEWLAAMVGACEAVHVHATETPEWLEQRLACLEDRRRELVSLTGLLARSDGRTVEHAARAASSLSPIDACGREVTDHERMPSPPDPDVRERVEAQLDLLADARAEFVAGHLEEGLAATREVLTTAREIGWAPLEAEALLVIGERVTDLERDPTKEREALHGAARRALTGKHWFLAVQAWARLSRGSARRGEVDEAKRWLDHGSGLAEDLPESLRLRADLAGARSQWHFHSGRYAEAETHARERKQLVADWFGADSPQAADSLNAIGVAVYMQGRKDEAVDHYREALAILERISGPDHPSVAAMHNNIGVVSTDRGSWAPAHIHYQRALAIRRTVYPRGNEFLVQSLINLANLYLMCESPRAGIGTAREIVATIATLSGESEQAAAAAGAREPELAAIRAEVVPWLLLLGRMLAGAGDHHHAMPILVHATTLLEAAPNTRLVPPTEPDSPAPPNLEGCIFDVATELERSATAVGDEGWAQHARATIAGSTGAASWMQRCAFEVDAWARRTP